MKKSLEFVVRSGVWLGTAGVLLLCLLFARLLFAPIDLGFARDELKGRAEAFLPGWQIDFDETQIGWDWRRVRPWIEIRDLELTDRANRMTARVPVAHVGVSFTSMLGNLSFSSIELDAAQVLVTDLGGFSDATGSGMFSNLFGEGGVPKPEVFRPVTEAFSRFGARLMRQAPALDSVTVTSASVEIVRGAEYPNAFFALPRFELTAKDGSLTVDSAMDIQLGSMPTQLRLLGQAEPEVGELQLSLSFSQLRPSDLSFQTELPEIVSALSVPVGLDLDLSLAANVGLRSARFNVTLDEGELFHPVSFPEGSPIRYGVIAGQYSAAEETIMIDTLEVQAGERLIAGEGVIRWIDGYDEPEVQLQLRGDEATVPEIKRYWPIVTYPDGTPRGARAWVDDHMSAGIAHNVQFDVNWSPELGGAFDHGSPYRLAFDFQGIDTLFLLTMPPILKAEGRAVLTHDVFDLMLDDGTVLGMPIAGSTAHMTDINIKGGATGQFDIRAQGDVPTVMELIAYPPLNVPERLKFDVARLDGKARVQARVTVPLIKDMPKDAVQYDVIAHLQDAKVDNLLGGEGLRQGDLTLILDQDRLSVEGSGTLNGVPMELYWRENMAAGRDDPKAETTEIVLSGLVDEQDIKAFGVDVSDYLAGKTQAEATFIGRNFAFTRGYFSADATGAVLKAPQFAWEKDAATPATITGTLEFAEGRTSLAPLVVEGEDIGLTLRFNWAAGEPNRFDGSFDVASLGGNTLKGTVRQEPGKPTQVSINAERFNAGAFLADTKKPAKANGEKSENDLVLSLRAAQLDLRNGETVDNVVLDTRFVKGEPHELTMDGKVHGTQKPIKLTIAPSTNPLGQAMTLISPDGGQMLRGLGLFSHIRDGRLELNAHTKGWGDSLRIKGRARIDNSFMVPKKNLSSAVTEGLVEGLSDFLSSGPVELSEIDIPFDYNAGLLDLSDLKANGPTLGMTMEGQISAREDKINVNGVFVPAYGINSLLGKIPLLGTLLTGGDGKGVFAVTYRVKGQLESPEFSVNPVSGLAPGFLRLLFEGKKGKVADVKTPKTPETEGAPAEAEVQVQAPVATEPEAQPKEADSGDTPAEDNPAPTPEPQF